MGDFDVYSCDSFQVNCGSSTEIIDSTASFTLGDGEHISKREDCGIPITETADLDEIAIGDRCETQEQDEVTGIKNSPGLAREIPTC